MGLGLSLVKKIITSFDGKIWVEDRVKDDYQKGAIVKFIIPEA
jgi:signal transduction histidine kinase